MKPDDLNVPTAVAKMEDDRDLYYAKAKNGEWFIAFQDKHDTRQHFRPGRETGEKWTMLLEMAHAENEPLMDHPYGVTMVRLNWLRQDAPAAELWKFDAIQKFLEEHPPRRRN